MKNKLVEQLADLEADERDFLQESGKLFLSVSTNHRHCPYPSLLVAFQADLLSNDLKIAVTRHVERCRLCARLAKDLSDLETSSPTTEEKRRIRARILDVIHELKARTTKNRFRLWAPTVAYATLALVILGSGLFLWRNVQQGRDRYAASAHSVLRLEKAAVKLPITLIWRGESGKSQAYIADLVYALEPYKASHYAEAVKQLMALTQRYPKGAEGYFYLGVSQLMLGQDSEATANLKQAGQLLAVQPSDALPIDEVTWYRVVAQIHAGRSPEASGELQKLCQTAGTYQARACAGLKELSLKD